MLSHLTQPVQSELEAFEQAYSEALCAPARDFGRMLDFISETRGKRIRPLIVLLSAKICGQISPKTISYAVILELLHTATLVHDDVVDNTRERRGRPSVMARFDNRFAVLLGDYILTQAIVLGVATDNLHILQLLSRLAQNLIDGELTQLLAAADPQPDERRYFETIRKKTALLLASCSEMGALSAGADLQKTAILHDIGANLGLCFQLKDDIFDYFEQGQLGKPTGNDIREGKITLPLLHALQTAPSSETAPLLTLIRNQDFSPQNIKRLIAFAKIHHGIEYAYGKMETIKAETLTLLAQFPDSEARTALIRLMDYVMEREK
jgi:octaprenyl-diphosphate synthase